MVNISWKTLCTNGWFGGFSPYFWKHPHTFCHVSISLKDPLPIGQIHLAPFAFVFFCSESLWNVMAAEKLHGDANEVLTTWVFPSILMTLVFSFLSLAYLFKGKNTVNTFNNWSKHLLLGRRNWISEGPWKSEKHRSGNSKIHRL